MNWIVYLLKVNLAMAVCWFLYRIIFKGLTFFQWNRFFLIGSVVLSFIMPLLVFHFENPMIAVADRNVIDWSYVDHLASYPAIPSEAVGGISIESVLLLLYLTVTIVFLFFSLRRIYTMLQLTSIAKNVRDGKVKVYVQQRKAGSFTVFRRIYLDTHAYNNQSVHVYNHEMVHATQFHSLDLILMEFVCITLWFNPFVFLLKRYVRENHEYLADEHARDNRDSLVEYLSCLRAETVRHHEPAIASYFKSSTIKKRIIMLTNHHSKRYKKWRYLVILPVIAFLIIAFQVPMEEGAVIPGGQIEALLEGPEPEYLLEGIPAIFPLPEKHKENITWGYQHKAIHPFTKKETIHQGLDIAAPKGTSVFATASGIVLKASTYDGWGKLVVLKHSNGYETAYAHLDQIGVEVGMRVKMGEEIGSVGSSGKSTGPHLHYEVKKDGKNVNPEDYY